MQKGVISANMGCKPLVALQLEVPHGQNGSDYTF